MDLLEQTLVIRHKHGSFLECCIRNGELVVLETREVGLVLHRLNLIVGECREKSAVEFRVCDPLGVLETFDISTHNVSDHDWEAHGVLQWIFFRNTELLEVSGRVVIVGSSLGSIVRSVVADLCEDLSLAVDLVIQDALVACGRRLIDQFVGVVHDGMARTIGEGEVERIALPIAVVGS